MAGHIIGLAHEHVRPDTDIYLHLECKYIQGFAALEEWLAQNRQTYAKGPKQGTAVLLNDFCNYGELSLIVPKSVGWEDGELVPWTQQANGLDMVGYVPTFVPLGKFDRQSIMLYPSKTTNLGDLVPLRWKDISLIQDVILCFHFQPTNC